MNNYIFPIIYFFKVVTNLILYTQFQQLSTIPLTFKDFSQSIKSLVIINFLLLITSIYHHYKLMINQENIHLTVFVIALVAEISFTLSYFAISVQPEKYTDSLNKLRGLTFANVLVQIFSLIYGSWLLYRDVQLGKRTKLYQAGYIPYEDDFIEKIKQQNLRLLDREKPLIPKKPSNLNKFRELINRKEEDIYTLHNTPIYLNQDDEKY